MITLKITTLELWSFDALQESFRTAALLVHFDPTQQTYADLELSGVGVGAIIYHSTNDPLSHKSIRLIIFLSRKFESEEKNYCPTRLDVVYCYWVVVKTRNMIEATKQPTITYTGHNATLQITIQTFMNTTALLVRLNKMHQRSSQYLSMFHLISRQ